MSEFADRANMTQDEYVDAIANLLFAHAPTQESLGEELEEVQSEDAEKLIDPKEEPVKESLKEDNHSLGSKDLRGKNITVAEYVKDHYNEIP